MLYSSVLFLLFFSVFGQRVMLGVCKDPSFSLDMLLGEVVFMTSLWCLSNIFSVVVKVTLFVHHTLTNTQRNLIALFYWWIILVVSSIFIFCHCVEENVLFSFLLIFYSLWQDLFFHQIRKENYAKRHYRSVFHQFSCILEAYIFVIYLSERFSFKEVYVPK